MVNAFTLALRRQGRQSSVSSRPALSIYQPELHSETLSQSNLKSCKVLLFHLGNKKNGLACCCCFGGEGTLLSGTRQVTLQGYGIQGVPAQGLWAPYCTYMVSLPLGVTKGNSNSLPCLGSLLDNPDQKFKRGLPVPDVGVFDRWSNSSWWEQSQHRWENFI